MTAQPDHGPEGPLAESTVAAIRTILALYDRRRLTLQTAIDEIAALVDVDRAHRITSGDAGHPADEPDPNPAPVPRHLRPTD